METNDTEQYTLSMWIMSRPEKIWFKLSAVEVSRFEQEYAAFLQSDKTKALYCLEMEDTKRMIRMDAITNYSVVLNTYE